MSASSASSTSSDIIIIGAGPAGTTAALFLAAEGIPSILIDKATFPRDKICGDAISGKSVEVLNKLNKKLNNVSYDELETFSTSSWGVQFVAPGGELLRVPFQTKKVVAHAPGFISKRIDFDNWLLEKARADARITLIEHTEIRQYRRESNSISALAKDGRRFDARLMIAADGANSTLAKNIGGLSTASRHNCFGLRAYYKGIEGLDANGFIELHFLKEVLPGYLWIFPLPNGEANVGIGMRADILHKRSINLKKSFEHVLEAHPEIKKRFTHAERLGEVKLHGLPLGSRRLKLSGDNYLLAGDAAQLIDPFTGEGIGNAMFSGMYAAEQGLRSVKQQNFSSSFVREYDQAVYGRLWQELRLSTRMQQLVNYPWLFNFIVRKANSNALLSETISCMFEDIDMRARLKNPLFYLKLMLG